jgi:hypothetical protein
MATFGGSLEALVIFYKHLPIHTETPVWVSRDVIRRVRTLGHTPTALHRLLPVHTMIGVHIQNCQIWSPYGPKT